MTCFFLSFPRLPVSLTVPWQMAQDARRTFVHSIRPFVEASPAHEFVIRTHKTGFELCKDGQLSGQFESVLEVLCGLEEVIEECLVHAIHNWVAFHAGAVRTDGSACLIAGDPDTGKTTTTLHLIEMGQIFLCEEVTPVEPETLRVHPYPQVLSLSRSYAQDYLSTYPVHHGTFDMVNARMARFHPSCAGSHPAPLKTILIPSYDPINPTRIVPLSPSQVFTELLGYCFPPNGNEEALFDAVIRICEKTQSFRIRARNIESMRECLQELFDLH